MEIKNGDVFKFGKDGFYIMILGTDGNLYPVWLNKGNGTPIIVMDHYTEEYPRGDKYIGNIAGNLTALNSKLIELGE